MTCRPRNRFPLTFMCLPTKTRLSPWRPMPRLGKRRRAGASAMGKKAASSFDDDEDALLNAAITSVAQERSELANTVASDELQHVVRRVGLVCPRYPGRHPVVARAVTDATRIRCLRCNTLPALGEVWAGCVPRHFLFCWQCASNYAGGSDFGPAHPCCARGSVHTLRFVLEGGRRRTVGSGPWIILHI